MDENKQLICDLLCKALKATRGASDLLSLYYDAESETVTARFPNGGRRVINVSMDSGTAMIYDIVKYLGC